MRVQSSPWNRQVFAVHNHKLVGRLAGSELYLTACLPTYLTARLPACLLFRRSRPALLLLLLDELGSQPISLIRTTQRLE